MSQACCIGGSSEAIWNKTVEEFWMGCIVNRLTTCTGRTHTFDQMTLLNTRVTHFLMLTTKYLFEGAHGTGSIIWNSTQLWFPTHCQLNMLKYMQGIVNLKHSMVPKSTICINHKTCPIKAQIYNSQLNIIKVRNKNRSEQPSMWELS